MAVAKVKKKAGLHAKSNGQAKLPKKSSLKKAATARNGRASAKYVYVFGGGKAEGEAGMKNLLGGKGANLAEMAALGLPVPAGFTATTEVCTAFYENKRKYPKELTAQVERALRHIEKIMGAEFGSKKNPLLVSVRSGARVSMPGMMDTVLNLGLNDQTVQGPDRKNAQ